MRLNLLLFVIFLTSCSSNLDNKNLNYDKIFSNQMSFEEFSNRLYEYGKNSSYPDIKN